MSCALRRVPCRMGRLARPISIASSSTVLTIPRCAPTTATQFGLHFRRSIPKRSFHSSQITHANEPDEKARDLNQKGLDEAEQQVRVKQKQVERPWLRENADKPPAEQSPQESPNAQGKAPHLPAHHSAITPHQPALTLTSFSPSRQTPDHPHPPSEAHRPPPNPRRERQREQQFS